MEPSLPPFSFGRASQAIEKSLHAAIRNSTRYCCSDRRRKCTSPGRWRASVWPVRLDKILAVVTKEARADAVIVESRVAELAEHRLLGRMIHGVLVLRVAPQRGLHTMTSEHVSLPTNSAGCPVAVSFGDWPSGRKQPNDRTTTNPRQDSLPRSEANDAKRFWVWSNAAGCASVAGSLLTACYAWRPRTLRG